MAIRFATPDRRRARRAYTLIEVLVIVTIIGIAGAVVVPQMLHVGSFGVQGAVRMLVADIHYAQSQAMTHQADHQLVFDPINDRYSLTNGAGEPITLQWRTDSQDNATVSFINNGRFSGVRLVSAVFPSMEDANVLAFDNLGAPLSGGTIVLAHRDEQYRITVAAFTGRVTVDRIVAE